MKKSSHKANFLREFIQEDVQPRLLNGEPRHIDGPNCLFSQ